ncbi:MAG: exodeoxyribonuclease VII small subunit [Actinomycetota bacterium]|nr:exodeoxyribonuclease VII small subunit [Actinomycetota bacterium]
MTNAVDPEDMGFEEAREELASIVARLESGGLSLEESLALWQRGEVVAAICTRWLDEARAKLDAAVAEREDEESDG